MQSRMEMIMFNAVRSGNKPIIYLAGKIAKHDWRTTILGDRAGAVPAGGGDPYFGRLFDPTLILDCGSFLYGGPFFISCDHGCSHGPASHGAGPGCCGDANAAEMRQRIWQINCERVRRASCIFAYVNELDCFGTLVELGFATALNKPIAIGLGHGITSKQFDDLWMPRACNNAGLLRGGPVETFQTFLREYGLWRGPPPRPLITALQEWCQ